MPLVDRVAELGALDRSPWCGRDDRTPGHASTTGLRISVDCSWFGLDNDGAPESAGCGLRTSSAFGDASIIRALDRMSTRTETAPLFWRWVLIVSEIVVGTYLIVMQLAVRHPRQETGAFLVVGILAFVAWVFLFFGSPFLVRSQRWLAIFGWFIAVAALIFSV